ncbi:MAG: hypothetical protein HY690_14625 [Chloroflexi bacterium]|nr:hypothetical protein [Chloroflexota bacterium]
MPVPYHQWHRLTRRDFMLAAEVPASQPNRRAWVGVYPLRDGEERFRIRHFEVERDRLERLDFLGEEDLLNAESRIVTGSEELERVLRRWLDDLGKLVQPAVCGYPI